jgi:tricorn protease-like protein
MAPSFTGGLFRLGAEGGRPARLTKPDTARGEGAHVWPAALPRGRGVLFTLWSGDRSFDQAKIAVQPSGAEPPRIVLDGGYAARYAPSGHLVFVRGGALHAAPFDLERLAVAGPAAPVVPAVLTDASTGAALFDVSEAGTLAFVPGGEHRQVRRMVWVDRKGKAQPVGDVTGPLLSPRLSRDGRRIALWREETAADVWVQDLSRDAMARVTFGGDSHSPTWSPDGTRLAYESGRAVMHRIFVKAADGTGGERRVTSGEHHQYLSDWSKDGRWLAYTEFHPETGADVWIASADGSAEARALARTPFSEKEAVFSPDGRWLAFVSDESGEFDVYLQPFPAGGARRRVSTGGGEEPAWSHDGRELFFRRGRQLLAVRLQPSKDVELDKPVVLFEGAYHDNVAPCRSYDVAPDGRFLMVTEPLGDDLPQELHVVLGWAEELKSIGSPP